MRRLPVLLFLPIAAAAAPSPLQLTSRVLAERRVAAADGTVRIVEQPARGAAPGDPVRVVLGYRNTGAVALAGVVLANPVPAGLAYRGPLAGMPEPEVSADGRRFARLAQLSVVAPEGARPATAGDVTQVRWRLDRPLAPGAGGSVGFRATVR